MDKLAMSVLYWGVVRWVVVMVMVALVFSGCDYFDRNRLTREKAGKMIAESELFKRKGYDALPLQSTRAELVEVTGIQVLEQQKRARVDFNWHGVFLLEARDWEREDKLAEDVKRVRSGEAVLLLYDDGWRLAEIDVGPPFRGYVSN
jgi:hypothetical protein